MNKSYEIPTIITLCLFALGIIVASQSETPMTFFQWAQYFAYLVSAGALVWLVYGAFQQGKSIEIQNDNISLQTKQIEINRAEIHVQQKQLELQRIELKKMSFASSLAHIKGMIEIARNDYQDKDHPERPIYLNDNAKAILESTNPRVVTKNCMDWQEEYMPYQRYIKRIEDAAKFYFTTNDIAYNKKYEDTDTFLYINAPLFSKTPYISDAYNTVITSVHLNSQMDDFPSKVTIAMMSAQCFLLPDLIHTDQLHKDAAKFTDSQLPKIYKKLVEAQRQTEAAQG